MEKSKGTRGLEGRIEKRKCLRMKSWVASICLGLASCRGKICKVPMPDTRCGMMVGKRAQCRIA